MKSVLLPAFLCCTIALGLLWAPPVSAKTPAKKGKSESAKKVDDGKSGKSDGKSEGKSEGEGGEEKSLNTKCPVSGEETDPEVTLDHEGRTIAFCCEGCPKEFKKDPAKYIAKLDEEAEAEGHGDGDKHHGKDGKGHDDEGESEGEAEEAALNTRCPVSGDDITDGGNTAEHEGRTIAFCCEHCVEDFQKDPAKFAAKLEKPKAKSGKKQDKKDEAEHDHDEEEEGDEV